MSNPNFSPEYSSNSIWYGTDMDECLTDHIDDMESDINSLQSSKADINHIHAEYAPIDHTHSNYAAASHKHPVSDITSGILPISKGGTGAETVAGALTNFGNIGKVYSSTPNDKSIEKMEMVTIASLTLPAGVYVIVGNHQWEVNGAGCMYISRITKSDDSVVYCIVRNDMIGGGGATAAAIIELTETTTIKYETYHQYTTATNAEAIRFHAVKIK